LKNAAKAWAVKLIARMGYIRPKKPEARPAPTCAITENAAKAWAAKLNSRLSQIQPKTL
jgi:hypothetical protein